MNPLLDGPDTFGFAQEDLESELESDFHRFQELQVRKLAMDVLGSPHHIEGASLRVLEVESRRAISSRQDLCYPPPQVHRQTLEQVLTIRNWIDVLGEIPLLSNIWLSWNNVWVKIDLLFWYRSSWHGVLIRSSSKVKDSHIVEAELCKHVLDASGISLGSFFLLHPYENYKRGPELDPGTFLHVSPLNTSIKHLRKPLSASWPSILSSALAGSSCMKRTCPLCRNELPALPKHSIYTLHKGGRAVQMLESEGILDLADILNASAEAQAELNPRHRIQIETVRSATVHVQASSIRSFLAQLEFPLTFLDFECTSQAIPPFEAVQPWEHIPFLLSIQTVSSSLVLESMELDPTLVVKGSPGLDARPSLVEGLVRHVPDNGTVIGYGIALEKMVLSRLAAQFPQEREKLLSIRDRLLDLQEIFAQFWYYHPDQKGKISLKKILPLLTNLDHQELILKNGGQAHLFWSALSEPAMLGPQEALRFNEASVQERIQEISDYAALDARGLVYLLVALNKFCAE